MAFTPSFFNSSRRRSQTRSGTAAPPRRHHGQADALELEFFPFSQKPVAASK